MSIKLMALVWEIDLPPGEKLVLLALADQANDAGTQCWPSVETIAHRSGQGVRTVRRALASLENAGHLTRQHREGTSTQYRVHPCQNGSPAKSAPLPKTTVTPANLAPKPPRTINNDLAKAKSTARPKVPRPEEVCEAVWLDFTRQRKKPITDTALRGIKREAAKAGWLLEAALEEATMRGWESFKADWVKDKRNGNELRQGGSTGPDKRSGLARAIDSELQRISAFP
jgi:hypothetical protein